MKEGLLPVYMDIRWYAYGLRDDIDCLIPLGNQYSEKIAKILYRAKEQTCNHPGGERSYEGREANLGGKINLLLY